MFDTWRAIRRIKKRLGPVAFRMIRPGELPGMIETEKFSMLCERADKRKLWALITGWDKATNKPAVWKDGELV